MKYELQLLIIYQGWLLNCTKQTILMEDLIRRGNWVWNIQESSTYYYLHNFSAGLKLF